MSQFPLMTPPPHALGGTHGRAAVLGWVVAAVELLVSACCIAGTYALAQDPSQFAQLPPEISAEQMVTVVQVVVTVSVGLLFAGPAVALLFLGFGVRRGSRAMKIAAMVILWTHAAFVGLTLLANLVQLATDPLAGLLSIAIFGGLLALIGWTLWNLHHLHGPPPAPGSGGPRDDGGEFFEPWNSHLPR